MSGDDAQRALEAALATLVFGEPVALDDPAQRDAWLAPHALRAEDQRWLTAVSSARLGLYRTLVWHNLRQTLQQMLPRTVVRRAARLDDDLRWFLEAHAPRGHLLRDVTPAFVEALAPRWEVEPLVPPYLGQLARLEAAYVVVASAPDEPSPDADFEPQLEQGLRLTAAARLLQITHAVHELPDDGSPLHEPPARAGWLWLYRDAHEELRCLELSPLAGAIVQQLQRGLALGAALRRACAEQGVALTPSVLEGAARVLGDLRDRGSILGSSGATSGA